MLLTLSPCKRRCPNITLIKVNLIVNSNSSDEKDYMSKSIMSCAFSSIVNFTPSVQNSFFLSSSYLETEKEKWIFFPPHSMQLFSFFSLASNSWILKMEQNGDLFGKIALCGSSNDLSEKLICKRPWKMSILMITILKRLSGGG